MRRWLLLIALLSASYACKKAPEALLAPDAGSKLVDAGEPPVSMDAGAQDLGIPDAGPPPRTLGRRGLFGDSPVDNRVIDPNFDLQSRGWSSINIPLNGQAQLAELSVQYHPRTPTRQPVLWVPGPGPLASVVTLGSVKAGGPMSVSLWLGRLLDQGRSPARASVIGVGADGASVIADLVEDPQSAVEMGNFVWVRYATVVLEPTVGFLSVLVSDEAGGALALTGVVARPISQNKLSGLSAPRAIARPLREQERRALTTFQAMLRSQLGARPPSPQPPFPR